MGLGCNNATDYPPKYLHTADVTLRYLEEYWTTNGRPSNFDVSQVVGPAGMYFVFTNTITISNAVYHCCFAARLPEWPAGVLAITENGVTVWIRDRDGKITISPGEYGIQP